MLCSGCRMEPVFFLLISVVLNNDIGISGGYGGWSYHFTYAPCMISAGEFLYFKFDFAGTFFFNFMSMVNYWQFDLPKGGTWVGNWMGFVYC
jgi:hypothetical protein